MAKVNITLEDKEGGAVSIEVSGDYEKDIAKCSPAQKAALESLVFILRDAKINDGNCSEEKCSECCGGCGEKDEDDKA